MIPDKALRCLLWKLYKGGQILDAERSDMRNKLTTIDRGQLIPYIQFTQASLDSTVSSSIQDAKDVGYVCLYVIMYSCVLPYPG